MSKLNKQTLAHVGRMASGLLPLIEAYTAIALFAIGARYIYIKFPTGIRLSIASMALIATAFLILKVAFYVRSLSRDRGLPNPPLKRSLITIYHSMFISAAVIFFSLITIYHSMFISAAVIFFVEAIDSIGYCSLYTSFNAIACSLFLTACAAIQLVREVNYFIKSYKKGGVLSTAGNAEPTLSASTEGDLLESDKKGDVLSTAGNAEPTLPASTEGDLLESDKKEVGLPALGLVNASSIEAHSINEAEPAYN